MKKESFQYVYGPVPSRRLGRSLGIDLVPYKTCSYDCIYCQLGRTTNKTIKRDKYIRMENLLEELDRKLSENVLPDYISLAGSGEPTLNLQIGEIIGKIKTMFRIPVAVITNSSLLWLPEVRESLMEADLVLPSLDAGDENLFRCINRSHEDISFEKMIRGLMDFSENYPGSIWLEVFLLDGVTGILSEVEKLSAIIRQIRPEKVHINTVTRPPAEKFAFPVPPERMKQYACLIWPGAEIIGGGSRDELSTGTHSGSTDADILALLSRRPCTVQDIALGLSVNPIEVSKQLQELTRKRAVKIIRREDAVYFETVRSL